MSDQQDVKNDITNKIEEICNAFEEVAKKLGVTVSIVVKSPDIKDIFTWYNCHFYDAAKMMAVAFYEMRTRVQQDLNT